MEQGRASESDRKVVRGFTDEPNREIETECEALYLTNQNVRRKFNRNSITLLQTDEPGSVFKFIVDVLSVKEDITFSNGRSIDGIFSCRLKVDNKKNSGLKCPLLWINISMHERLLAGQVSIFNLLYKYSGLSVGRLLCLSSSQLKIATKLLNVIIRREEEPSLKMKITNPTHKGDLSPIEQYIPVKKTTALLIPKISDTSSPSGLLSDKEARPLLAPAAPIYKYIISCDSLQPETKNDLKLQTKTSSMKNKYDRTYRSQSIQSQGTTSIYQKKVEFEDECLRKNDIGLKKVEAEDSLNRKGGAKTQSLCDFSIKCNPPQNLQVELTSALSLLKQTDEHDPFQSLIVSAVEATAAKLLTLQPQPQPQPRDTVPSLEVIQSYYFDESVATKKDKDIPESPQKAEKNSRFKFNDIIQKNSKKLFEGETNNPMSVNLKGQGNFHHDKFEGIAQSSNFTNMKSTASANTIAKILRKEFTVERSLKSNILPWEVVLGVTVILAVVFRVYFENIHYNAVMNTYDTNQKILLLNHNMRPFGVFYKDSCKKDLLNSVTLTPVLANRTTNFTVNLYKYYKSRLLLWYPPLVLNYSIHSETGLKTPGVTFYPQPISVLGANLLTNLIVLLRNFNDKTVGVNSPRNIRYYKQNKILARNLFMATWRQFELESQATESFLALVALSLVYMGIVNALVSVILGRLGMTKLLR